MATWRHKDIRKPRATNWPSVRYPSYDHLKNLSFVLHCISTSDHSLSNLNEMIHAVIVMNTHGKPRITKFYKNLPAEKQQEIIRAVYSGLSSREDKFCNFVEADDIFGPDTKLVYKHFATLYFVFAIDSAENELGILDLIQLFVEILDKSFKNVCELDIVYNFNKVHTILDEIVMGGLVVETDSAEIWRAVQEINKLEKESETTPMKAIGFRRR